MKKSDKIANAVRASSATLNKLISSIQPTDYTSRDKKQLILHTHPHIRYLEEKIKELEGGANALVVDSLESARYLLFKALLKQGDNIVSYNSWSLYFNDEPFYKNSGISFRLSVDGKLSTFLDLIDERTKLIYLETVSPEFRNLPDIKKITAIAKQKNIPVVVDNTAGGPGYLTSPIHFGANIVLLDTSPWLVQNRNHAGAVIVEDGIYNWRNQKFNHLSYDERLTKRNNSSEKKKPLYFSILEYIRQSSFVKNILLTDELGAQYDLENIEYILFRKSENASLLANWLKKQSYVEFVEYLGFVENENHLLATSLFKGGFGNTFSFKLKPSFLCHEQFVKLIRAHEIPPYLFQLQHDAELSNLIVSTGYGDFEEIKRFFLSVLTKPEKVYYTALKK